MARGGPYLYRHHAPYLPPQRDLSRRTLGDFPPAPLTQLAESVGRVWIRSSHRDSCAGARSWKHELLWLLCGCRRGQKRGECPGCRRRAPARGRMVNDSPGRGDASQDCPPWESQVWTRTRQACHRPGATPTGALGAEQVWWGAEVGAPSMRSGGAPGGARAPLPHARTGRGDQVRCAVQAGHRGHLRRGIPAAACWRGRAPASAGRTDDAQQEHKSASGVRRCILHVMRTDMPPDTTATTWP